MKNINILNRNIYRVFTKIYGRKFRVLGKKTCMFSPMQIDNPKGISLYDNVMIAHGAWLMGTDEYTAEGLVVKEKTVIGHFCHIIAMKTVKIEESVLIADKVFISDCSHTYVDIQQPIINQKTEFLGAVVIGEGSWIGENVCILGVKIGKHCVIAANSVVTNDVADYCVVAGAPARVIKRYDDKIKEWISV